MTGPALVAAPAALALPRMVVTAAGLTKRFGRLEVLRGVDFAVRTGRVTAILGPNGAGKSTVIKTLLGLVRPDGGSIALHGAEIGDDPAYRARIGYMPQQARFPENLTGREVVHLLRDLRDDTVPEDDDLFEAFGLVRELDKPVRTLSGGTRQKLNAAVAFMFRPSLLILDEPTAGLDPIASGVLKARILRARAEGASVLLSSHVLSELEELVDDVIFLLEGRVEFQGSLRRLKETTGETRLERAIARLMQRGTR
ncbi:MAG TPA: ABC transporter ATP-binding protein [Gemmatimonadales bacterium]|nr:ABC transporter ATP-binding protein [Gemmatimonadales bacterium]